jgi:hypothetical protein
MKPLHVALLLMVGAIGGAVVLKVSQSLLAKPVPAVVAAKAQEPLTVPTLAQPALAAAPAVAPVEPVAVAPAAPENAKPSPIAPRHSAASQRAAAPEPVQMAQNQNPPPPEAAPEPAPVSLPTVPDPIPAPAPVPVEPAAMPAPPPPAAIPPTAPPAQTVTIRPGTVLNVRLIDGLSSDRNLEGDQFSASLDQPLIVDGFVIAERGARVQGRVVAATKAGKASGVASLSVELTRLRTSDGQNVALSTEAVERRSAQNRGEEAAKIGGAAAVGAIIGAIAGGGKGAAVGAGVGGGAGAGGVLLTRGKPAALPTETRLEFRVREAVTLTERRR